MSTPKYLYELMHDVGSNLIQVAVFTDLEIAIGEINECEFPFLDCQGPHYYQLLKREANAIHPIERWDLIATASWEVKRDGANTILSKTIEMIEE